MILPESIKLQMRLFRPFCQHNISRTILLRNSPQSFNIVSLRTASASSFNLNQNNFFEKEVAGFLNPLPALRMVFANRDQVNDPGRFSACGTGKANELPASCWLSLLENLTACRRSRIRFAT